MIIMGVVVDLGAEAGATTPPTVPIGVICSCTGPEAASLSQTTPTIEAWATWVNHHGGLSGRHVKLVAKDDGYNPSTSLSDAEELIQQDHVVAIIDNSDVDASWSSYAKQQGVAVIGGGISLAGYTNPDFFPPSATFNYLTTAGAILSKRYGIKKQSDLYCSEVAICAQSEVQAKAAGAAFGIDFVYTAAIGFAAPTYTAECLASKAAGATAMTVGDATTVVEKVAAECAAQGYTPIQVSSDGTVAEGWLNIPGMEGNIDTQANLPWFDHNSATKDMYAALAKYAPQVAAGPNFGEIVLATWADGALIQAAVQATSVSSADTITAGKIKIGLYSLPKGDTLGGLAPPLHFVKGQPANNSCFFTMAIKHHKFVVLQDGKLLCAPLHQAGWPGPGST
jgi:branched-chain amino acid transport system substrate-binding protein